MVGSCRQYSPLIEVPRSLVKAWSPLIEVPWSRAPWSGRKYSATTGFTGGGAGGGGAAAKAAAAGSAAVPGAALLSHLHGSLVIILSAISGLQRVHVLHASLLTHTSLQYSGPQVSAQRRHTHIFPHDAHACALFTQVSLH